MVRLGVFEFRETRCEVVRRCLLGTKLEVMFVYTISGMGGTVYIYIGEIVCKLVYWPSILTLVSI